MHKTPERSLQLTRRHALKLIASSASLLALNRTGNAQSATAAEYAPTRESLNAYRIPDWFADAKFGIWSHWGPQSAIGDGDWYARNMYVEGSPQYEYHLHRFGPQSKVGYKDTIPLFTADRWDPDHLMDLYVRAGAKYFFSMGVHHDNFDLWDSKYQPRWNAVHMGPQKNIVALWASAARRRGLRFGVSEHLSNSFDWFAPSHRSDSKGAFAGIPYDGSDPKFADLYHSYADQPKDFAVNAQPMGRVAPEQWKRHYLQRIQDLLDQHQPDLLYTDGGIPFEEYGLQTVAQLYNTGGESYRGEAEAVYFSKISKDCAVGTCVLDRERGVADNIWPTPWQTDTCIGDWHYKAGREYKSAKTIVDLLVDIVSKNGNLLLNFPLPASGELDARELRILADLTAWMTVNGEGIFHSRPWTTFGEGPSLNITGGSGSFNEQKRPPLGPSDVRFTTKGRTLFAFVQGWPQSEVSIHSLGIHRQPTTPKINAVEMLGHNAYLQFTQDADSLTVKLPEQKPAAADIGITLKMNLS